MKKPIFSLRKDLGLQLLALYTLFVVPIVIFALFFDNLVGARLKQEIMSADLALAGAIAQETNTLIKNALTSVEQLSGYDVVIEADIEEMQTLFGQVNSVRPDVNLIYRLDSEGIMLVHYPVEPNPAEPTSTVGVDFSFREYFQRALTTQEPLISLGRISPTTEQAVATAVMPIWEGDKFQGVVATNMKLQSFSTTLASIAAEYKKEDGFQVMIIDSGGRVIAYPDPDFLLTDFRAILPQVTEAVLNNQSGNLITAPENNQETLYSYIPVQSAGWGVIVSRPTAVAFATPASFHNAVLLMIGVFLGIGVFFWIALSTRVIRPLERLTEYSQAIGVGKQIPERDLEALNSIAARQDQIGHLVRSFTRMENSIRARINELATLLETSAAVVSSLETSTVLNRILDQVGHLLDIEKTAIVALDEPAGVFRAQASRGLSQRYASQLEISPDEASSITMRAIRSGNPVLIHDTEENPAFTPLRPRARAEGYRSFAAIPLKTIHAPPAALVLYSAEPDVFSERVVNLLSSFANQAAMAIENAALFARSDMRLQEQTRRLEALIQSLDAGLILEDLNKKILYINRSVSQYVSIAPEEIVGKPVNELFEAMLEHAEDREHVQGEVKKVVEGQVEEVPSIAFNLKDERRYLRLKGFTVTDSTGLLIGRGQILQDITKEYEIDKMKSSLISTVSHELRTPLAAIKGYATTLLADDVDWEVQAQEEFLEIISSETDRLSELVNNLLDMSRIEAGSLTLSRTICDLKELALRSAARAYPNPGDRFALEMPDNLPSVFADPQRIEVVLRNLIENATKYSNNELPIQVSAQKENRGVVVRVADQGPGIPLESGEDVFKSFYRLENGLTRKTPGVGLGLAISRGFIHAHGGEIWVEPKKAGTCVAFSLPVVEGELASNFTIEAPEGKE